MADYLVQEEDGSSRLTLEEADGFLLLEDFFDLADGECAIELGDGSGFIELGDGSGVLLLALCPAEPVTRRKRGGRLRRKPEPQKPPPRIERRSSGIAYLSLQGHGTDRLVHFQTASARFDLTGTSTHLVPRIGQGRAILALSGSGIEANQRTDARDALLTLAGTATERFHDGEAIFQARLEEVFALLA